MGSTHKGMTKVTSANFMKRRNIIEHSSRFPLLQGWQGLLPGPRHEFQRLQPPSPVPLLSEQLPRALGGAQRLWAIRRLQAALGDAQQGDGLALLGARSGRPDDRTTGGSPWSDCVLVSRML